MKLVTKMALVVIVGIGLFLWAWVDKSHAANIRWEGLDKPTRIMRPAFFADVTAYNALPEQTDDAPCETANGTWICDWATEKTNAALDAYKENSDKVCAVNGLPFGKKFWSTVTGFCVSLDRMNSRYKPLSRVDVLLRTKAEAKAFGVKRNVPFYVVD